MQKDDPFIYFSFSNRRFGLVKLSLHDYEIFLLVDICYRNLPSRGINDTFSVFGIIPSDPSNSKSIHSTSQMILNFYKYSILQFMIATC